MKKLFRAIAVVLAVAVPSSSAFAGVEDVDHEILRLLGGQAPGSQGSAGQFLQTNGAGTLTWQSLAASSFGNQSANTVLAGPTSGGAAAPTFRSLVAADLGTTLDVRFNSIGVGRAASGTAGDVSLVSGAKVSWNAQTFTSGYTDGFVEWSATGDNSWEHDFCVTSGSISASPSVNRVLIDIEGTDTGSSATSCSVNTYGDGASKFVPWLEIGSASATGGANQTAAGVAIKTQGGRRIWVSPDGTEARLSSATALSFSSGTDPKVTAADLFMLRDGANNLAHRNGASAQLVCIYNTFTSATNNEKACLDWQTTANVFQVCARYGSAGGTPRQLVVGATGMITDVLPPVNVFRGEDAWSQASSNTSGANTAVAGGIGRRFWSLSGTIGNLVGKTFTTTVNGTAVVLTDGTDFTHGASMTAEATNLAAAINANGTLGPQVTATASTTFVYVQPKPTCYSLAITDNQLADAPVTQGTDGNVTFPNGTAAAPPIVFTSSSTSGLYSVFANQLGLTISGTAEEQWTASYQQLASGYSIGWSSSTVNGTNDLEIFRVGAAGVLGIAQTFAGQSAEVRIFNVADTRGAAQTNSEYLSTAWSGNVCTIQTAKTGTGTVRALGVVVNGTLNLTGGTVSGTPTWSSNQAITLSTASQPNVTSVGTLAGLTMTGTLSMSSTPVISGSPACTLGATTVTTLGLGAGNAITWSGRSSMNSSADGLIEFRNNAGTGFTRLNFGGTSSSFPALTVSGANLNLTLADGTAGGAFITTLVQGNDGSSGTAAVFRGGAGSAGAGASGTFQGGNGAGTDKAAGGAILSSGNSSGAGTSSVNLQVAPIQGSGSGTNTATTFLSIAGNSIQNGSFLTYGCIRASTTLNTGSTSTNTAVVPAHSYVLGVVTRVITTITTAANYAVKDNASTNTFIAATTNITSGSTATGITYSGTTYYDAANTFVIITNANPGAGVVEVIIYYCTLTPPTS